MRHIAVLGPNPAWQKTLFFDRFQYGGINRAREMQCFPAGKGINFCRAAKCHGKVPCKLIQFGGGDTGGYICRELGKEEMDVWTVRTVAPTRTCSTCLCLATQTMTEIIEPSYAATTAEVASMLEYFHEALEGAEGAAFCGTLPTGTDPYLYGRAARLAAEFRKPLLLDSYQNLQPVFDSGAELWLKINADELRAMTGEADIRAALRKVFTFNGIRFAAITDGPSDAWCGDGTRTAVYHLPELEKVVNPIGCGDTASAVWMSEILSGTDPFEAFRIALGAASANCLSAFPGSYDPAEAARIAAVVTLA